MHFLARVRELRNNLKETVSLIYRSNPFTPDVDYISQKKIIFRAFSCLTLYSYESFKNILQLNNIHQVSPPSPSITIIHYYYYYFSPADFAFVQK